MNILTLSLPSLFYGPSLSGGCVTSLPIFWTFRVLLNLFTKRKKDKRKKTFFFFFFFFVVVVVANPYLGLFDNSSLGHFFFCLNEKRKERN